MKFIGQPLPSETVDFGVRMKRFRLDRQMSEEELGLLLCVSSQSIARLEHGAATPAEPVRQRFEWVVNAASFYAPVGCANDGKPEAALVSRVEANRTSHVEEALLDRREGLQSACPDRQAFGIRLAGDSMEPQYRSGQVIVVMPNCLPKHGCLVVARLLTGGVLFKKFTVRKNRPHRFKLCSYNRKYPPVDLRWSEVQWVYPVFSAKGHATRPNRAA